MSGGDEAGRARSVGTSELADGFTLKAGLAIRSASFLWMMSGLFAYDSQNPDLPQAVQRFRVCSGIIVGVLFGNLTDPIFPSCSVHSA